MATVAAGPSKPAYVPPHLRGQRNRGPRRDEVNNANQAYQDASAFEVPIAKTSEPKQPRQSLKASKWAKKDSSLNVHANQTPQPKPKEEDEPKPVEAKRVDTPQNSPPPPEASNGATDQANSSSPTKEGRSAAQETAATSVIAVIEKPADEKTAENAGNHGWNQNRNRNWNRGANGQQGQERPKKMTMREAMKQAKAKSPPQMDTRKVSPDSNAWGSPDTEGHLRKVPSHEDPYTAVNRMVDWEGNLLPPPVEWVERTRFVDPRFYETITTWVMSSSNQKEVIDITKESTFHDEKNGELAPRSWVLETVDGQSLQSHWQHTYLIFLEEDDPNAKPFWHLYISNQSSCLVPLEVPDAMMDPLDEGFKAYNKDNGSNAKAVARQQKLEKRRKGLVQFREEERRLKAQPNPIAPPPNPLRPKINMYIRPANNNDIPKITAIYNHYAENTCFVSEQDHIAQNTMRDRLRDAANARLPFLVAVAKANMRNRKSRDDNPYLEYDTVIGYAQASELGDGRNMYFWTAEIEIYVDPKFYTKGAGKNLLDRLLFCLDSSSMYKVSGGCDWDGREDWEYGARRKLGHVLCHVPYATQDLARIAWVGGLLERFQFEKVGDIKDIGVKYGQAVSEAIFKWKTGCEVEPTNPYK